MTKTTQRFARGAAFCTLALGATLEATAQHCTEDIYQCGVQIDDESFYRQWGLKAINVCGAWSMGYMGDGIVVGIVDAGILEYHPDLLGQVQPVIGGCSEERPDFSECRRCVSEDTHGTSLASIVAALANNPDNGLGWNMVGVAPDATLAEVFIYDDGGGDPGSIEEHIQVIGFNNHCIDVKVHAYDLAGESGGKYVPIPGSIRGALDTAVSGGRGGLGQVFVWTSGNGGAQSERADYEELVSARHSIVVGAIDEDLIHLDISETGSCLSCVAPGKHLVLASRVTRLCPCDPPPYIPNYVNCESEIVQGTSYAAPHVAGVVALMEQANANLSWRDVQEAIVQTSATIDPGGGWFTNQAGINHSYEYGHGLIDAYEAVSFVTGTNGYPAWEPLLGERQVVVPLAPNSVQVGPGQTVTLTVAATANMRLEHVELVMDVGTTGAPGIGPLEIEIERIWPLYYDGGRAGHHLTQSVFAVARDDPSPAYDDALFTSVRHWGEAGTATWKVRLRNTSDAKDPVTATWDGAELRFYGTPKCVADWNLNGVGSEQDDWADYMALCGTLDPLADLNGDRVVDEDDLAEFVVEFAAGCE